MKVLSIVDTAYRATNEEQDDTILWLTHAVKKAGAQVSLLLRGNAVNYAVNGHDASGLRIGDWQISQPPRLDRDLVQLAAAGVPLFALDEDIRSRGLERLELVAGLKTVARRELPQLFDEFDCVWHW